MGAIASQITSLTINCLLNRLFWRRSKKTSKLHVTGLCVGNSPGTGEFPAQMTSYVENVSIWWRHHAVWNGTSARGRAATDSLYYVIIVNVCFSVLLSNYEKCSWWFWFIHESHVSCDLEYTIHCTLLSWLHNHHFSYFLFVTHIWLPL